ncbi:hypothetical protein DPEC_G00215110 [Dallia pectoralis]|uniref:Uncharacterized protein n=1 Tax=Dallia pectoralis TaxID=75939 RepID=A0ACC2G2G1_DALPE|nr:hypothetical protein DPEC_G00215110 [Dallia pectoralis]
MGRTGKKSTYTHAQIMLLQSMKMSNYQLPLVVTDSGTPPLSNSTEITVRVCSCKGRMQCNAAGSICANLMMLLLAVVLRSLLGASESGELGHGGPLPLRGSTVIHTERCRLSGHISQTPGPWCTGPDNGSRDNGEFVI